VGKWDVLTLDVLTSEPVEGYHDMIRARRGQRLELVVDRAWLPPGQELSGATVRLAGTVAGPDVVKVAWADPAVTVLPGSSG
jgi:hypothetical protein